ncbi:hypothetical protein D3C74_338160 [compost metagenome]
MLFPSGEVSSVAGSQSYASSRVMREAHSRPYGVSSSYFMSRYVRSAGDMMSRAPLSSAAWTSTRSAFVASPPMTPRSRSPTPQYWISAPGGSSSDAPHWCQPITVLPWPVAISFAASA